MGTKTSPVGSPQDVFRQRLRDLRTAQGLSQAQLASRVSRHGGHVPRVTITRLETGPREVTLDELLSLAAALRVSPLVLLLPAEESQAVRVDNATLSPQEFANWYLGMDALGPEGWGPGGVPESVAHAILSKAPFVARVMAEWEEDGSDEQLRLLEAAGRMDWLLRKHALGAARPRPEDSALVQSKSRLHKTTAKPSTRRTSRG